MRFGTPVAAIRARQFGISFSEDNLEMRPPESKSCLLSATEQESAIRGPTRAFAIRCVTNGSSQQLEVQGNGASRRAVPGNLKRNRTHKAKSC
jgi:hypothetical protein